MQPVTRPGSYWSPCQGPSPGPGDPRGEAGRSLTSHPTGHAGLTYPAPSRSAASPLTPGLWASDPRQSPKSKVPLRRGEFSSSEDIQSGITSKQAPCKEPECQLCWSLRLLLKGIPRNLQVLTSWPFSRSQDPLEVGDLCCMFQNLVC